MNLSRLVRRVWLEKLGKHRKATAHTTLLAVTRLLIRVCGSSLYLRRCADYASGLAPLNAVNDRPSIHLHIVASAKDFALLPLVISQVTRNCLNAIERVLVIVPDLPSIELPSLPDFAEVIKETAVLPTSTLRVIDSHHPVGRRGWILQQALKLWSARNSESEGVLIIDADTILTQPRVFLGNSGKQVLSYSHEYHTPYEIHATKIWGPRKRDFGLSYVCHHQLMQPDILREMFPTVRDFEKWILEADILERSPIADYHCYGRWLVDHYPHRATYARWGNRSVPITRDSYTEARQAAEHLRESSIDTFSISFHHYLHEGGKPS